MSFYDDYGIGDAQQFFGDVAPWAQEEIPQALYSNEGRNYPTPVVSEEGYYSNEGRNYPTPVVSEEGYYSNEGRNYPTTESTQGPGGSPVNASMTTDLGRFGSFLKDMGGKALNFAQTPQGLMALLAAIVGAATRQGPSGGGAKMGIQAPRQYSRSVDPSGIVRYAAEGGLMHAYANGGAVRPFPMQDGGFVMTGRAVEGAGGIDDLQQILPEARPITGPGTATSDSIPATIRGRNGITPAKVSNGEAYVPPGRDTKGLYALMRELERKA